MDYSACWDWIQSLNMMVSSFKWNQPIEYLQSTLICDAPRYFRREWNQRSRENTDFAIISTATKKGYQRWSHCHRHVLQAMVKNLSSLGHGSNIDLNLDNEMVENLLRILYTRQYVAVDSITDNHQLVLRFAEELQFVPDRMTAIRNYLRSEFHRFASNRTFLQLSENELRHYLNIDTIPLHTVLDANTVFRSLLTWATHPRHCSSDNITFTHLNRFSSLATILVEVLEQIHGDLAASTANFATYKNSFHETDFGHLRPESTDCDLAVICSDDIEVLCQREILCRVAYFNSMLHGGFRESLERDHLRLEMPSSIFKVVLESITTGTVTGLCPDRLLEVYTMFDYLQSDQLFEVLDKYFRRNVFLWIEEDQKEFLLNISPSLMHRVLPFILTDFVEIFGLRGYAFALRFLLKWIEGDVNRDEFVVPILTNALNVLDSAEHSRKVVYESFDGHVHMFDGKTWAPCHWGDFDSSREGVYNFQVTQYKKRYLAHNFLRSNTIAHKESQLGTETVIARHSEGASGYFVEMFGRVFFSVNQQHYVLTEKLQPRHLQLPIVDGSALEPRCFDEKSRRIFFDTEEVGYFVEVDEEFRVVRQAQYSSIGVTPDHQLCVLEEFVFALKLGHDSFVLDEDRMAFIPLNMHRNLSESESCLDFDLILPRISGVIYKIFGIENSTFLIVTEDVELTQARLRVSETESDPKVVGFYQWCRTSKQWRDILASSGIPRTQIQLTVVMNHPGIPLYARRVRNI